MRSWLRHLTAGFKRPSGGAAMLDHILLEREDAPRPPLGRRLLHGLTAPFRALWRLTRWLFRTLIRLIRSILRLLGRLLRLPIRLIAWPFRRRRIRKIVRTPETGAKPRLRYRDVLSWPFRLAGRCVRLLVAAALWPFRQARRLWRERKYRRLRDLPISASFVLYTTGAFLAGTLICMIVIEICQNIKMDLYYRYDALSATYIVPEQGRYAVRNSGPYATFIIYDENGEVAEQFTVDYRHEEISYLTEVEYAGSAEISSEFIGNYFGPYGFTVTPRYSTDDRIKSVLTSAISVLILPIGYGGALIFCAVIFYRRKLKKPIAILRMGSARIARNQLDFTIAYDSRNEMGQLCESFEKMRDALMRSNLEMWRHMEERKRLNAAFSHDLRTPLTVLKGHASMLLDNVPQGNITADEIVSEVTTMSNSIVRMEKYVDAMARLQRLEDVEIRCENVDFDEIAQSLRDSAQILCGQKKLVFEAGDDGSPVSVDREIVQQVYENILANGVRYAVNCLCVRVLNQNGRLTISVGDDGPGFSSADLEKGTHPFYKAKAATNDGHLGLGLNICKILCQRHGGDIRLENDNGGRVTVSFAAV